MEEQHGAISRACPGPARPPPRLAIVAHGGDPSRCLTPLPRERRASGVRLLPSGPGLVPPAKAVAALPPEGAPPPPAPRDGGHWSAGATVGDNRQPRGLLAPALRPSRAWGRASPRPYPRGAPLGPRRGSCCAVSTPIYPAGSWLDAMLCRLSMPPCPLGHTRRRRLGSG